MKIYGSGLIYHKGNFLRFEEGVIETEDEELAEQLKEKGYKIAGKAKKKKDEEDAE